MARNFFEIEKGLRVTGENSYVGYAVIFGTTVPDGVAGDQGTVEIGSLYIRTGTAEIYQKVANTGAPADYKKLLTQDDILGLSWRSEKVVALTNDTLSVGVKDATTFTDDDAPTLTGADFVAGVSHIIGGAGTSPVLYKVTNVAGDNLTLALADDALAANDSFVVTYYLPDAPDAQEKQAIVNYNGSVMVKLGDINWNIADGINLSASYVAASGNITSADTVDSAIRKLDGNLDAVNTSLGTAQGATGMGTFTGSIIPDGSSVKTALQSLETAVEGLGVVNKEITGAGAQILDEVLVDNAYAVKWLVRSLDTVSGGVAASEIWATHNGTASADATVSDNTVYGKIKSGTVAGLAYAVTLSGTGAAQVLRLTVTGTHSCIHRAKRLEVLDI